RPMSRTMKACWARKRVRQRTLTLRRLSPEAAIAVLGLILTACSSIGPGTVPRDRVDYANALSDSWQDQMLLNIVRLRYAAAPSFMDVSSVIGAYAVQAAVQAGGAANLGVSHLTTITPTGNAFVNATAGYFDRPTISYTPLSGIKF